MNCECKFQMLLSFVNFALAKVLFSADFFFSVSILRTYKIKVRISIFLRPRLVLRGVLVVFLDRDKKIELRDERPRIKKSVSVGTTWLF